MFWGCKYSLIRIVGYHSKIRNDIKPIKITIYSIYLRDILPQGNTSFLRITTHNPQITQEILTFTQSVFFDYRYRVIVCIANKTTSINNHNIKIRIRPTKYDLISLLAQLLHQPLTIYKIFKATNIYYIYFHML